MPGEIGYNAAAKEIETGGNTPMQYYEHIKAQDPEVYAAMMRELSRQRDHIELIAS